MKNYTITFTAEEIETIRNAIAVRGEYLMSFKKQCRECGKKTAGELMAKQFSLCVDVIDKLPEHPA